MGQSSCAVDGCTERGPYVRGLCPSHYNRWRLHGDPLHGGPLRPKRLSVEERFWEKVDKNSTVPAHAPHLGPCWLWTGHLDTNGYGQMNAGIEKAARNLTTLRAHRVSYELHFGPIPGRLQIDHLCRNIRCVNPAHLDLVTNRENAIRGNQFRGLKTHCKHGHEFTVENTRITPSGNRSCRACAAAHTRARWRKFRPEVEG